VLESFQTFLNLKNNLILEFFNLSQKNKFQLKISKDFHPLPHAALLNIAQNSSNRNKRLIKSVSDNKF
jgi:hypothetical protein